MLSIILWALLFCFCLFLVIKSADYFTDGAEKIALNLGISQWVIGLTLVALGTSLPELFTSFSSALAGKPELIVDNIVGSNIANILLIVGLSAIFARKLVIHRDLINLDLPLLLGSQAVFFVLLFDGNISWIEGILSLLILFVYLGYTLSVHKDEAIKNIDRKDNLFKLFGIIIVSLLVLIFSSKYTITSMIKLGELLNISSSLLGITALAIGTSLPELMVSISAARKGNFEMSFGNILGSNIFNSAGVIGLTSLFYTLPISLPTMSVGLMFLVIATLMCVISGISKKIHIWEGFIFIITYLLFIGKLFGLF